MLTITALILASAPAPAPVYLDCTILQKRGPVEWKLTLYEGDGMVDYDNIISGPQRQTARFTADKVFFVGFQLSRVDLTILRAVTSIDGKVEVESGTCRLATASRRAF